MPEMYFLGAEQPNFVNTLLDNGATAMGLSYSSLVRRANGKPRTALADRFPEDHKLLLDSGAYLANSDPAARTKAEWTSYAMDYVEFALANAERCTLITEFDFLGLGLDWIDEMRRGVWRELKERFLPVWHPEHGIAALEATANYFGRVGVLGNVLTMPGQTAQAQLIRLARQGIEVHGLSLTKLEVVENIPFTSVSSSSWISPIKFKDAIVWDGRKLHRYPKKYAEQGRRRHGSWVEQNGFSAERWLAGDKSEIIDISVWSWLEWAKAMTARHGGAPQLRAVEPDNSEDLQDGGVIATISTLPVVLSGSNPVEKREQINLPIFTFEEVDKEGEDGARELLPVLAQGSVRSCDRCFLAANNCPGYQPGAQCAFKFPVRVETKGQRKAGWNSLIEMQFQRVALMRFNEELTGGYADPNLSSEIDRLIKMMVSQAEVEDERDYFSMTVTAKTKTGVMSRLFGGDVGAAASRLPQPLSALDTDRYIEGVLTDKS